MYGKKVSVIATISHFDYLTLRTKGTLVSYPSSGEERGRAKGLHSLKGRVSGLSSICKTKYKEKVWSDGVVLHDTLNVSLTLTVTPTGFTSGPKLREWRSSPFLKGTGVRVHCFYTDLLPGRPILSWTVRRLPGRVLQTRGLPVLFDRNPTSRHYVGPRHLGVLPTGSPRTRLFPLKPSTGLRKGSRPKRGRVGGRMDLYDP